MASGPTNVAGRLDREIVLPDVNAVGARQPGDVGAVVDDERPPAPWTRATAWSASARRAVKTRTCRGAG